MQYPANFKPLPEDQGPGGGLDPLTPNSIVTERFQNPERFRVRLAVPPGISSLQTFSGRHIIRILLLPAARPDANLTNARRNGAAAGDI